ncbi:hypothetical protein Tco_1397930, partial [Tanacetum coccineum]
AKWHHTAVYSHDWRQPLSCHEEVDDDLGEAMVVHLITLLDILVFYLINEIFLQKVGIVYVLFMVHAPEDLSFEIVEDCHIRAYLKHFSEVLKIHNMFLIVHFETNREMMNCSSGPKLLQVNFWNIRCDLECLVKGSEFQNIIDHLKSCFFRLEV